MGVMNVACGLYLAAGVRWLSDSHLSVRAACLPVWWGGGGAASLGPVFELLVNFPRHRREISRFDMYYGALGGHDGLQLARPFTVRRPASDGRTLIPMQPAARAADGVVTCGTQVSESRPACVI